MAKFGHEDIQRYIEIDKDRVPYSFGVADYDLEIRYNSYNDRFYAILRDSEDNILGEGEEKLIQDFPLFWIYQEDAEGNRDPSYPGFNLVPRSVDGNTYEVNWDNLGEKVLLSYEEV